MDRLTPVQYRIGLAEILAVLTLCMSTSVRLYTSYYLRSGLNFGNLEHRPGTCSEL